MAPSLGIIRARRSMDRAMSRFASSPKLTLARLQQRISSLTLGGSDHALQVAPSVVKQFEQAEVLKAPRHVQAAAPPGVGTGIHALQFRHLVGHPGFLLGRQRWNDVGQQIQPHYKVLRDGTAMGPFPPVELGRGYQLPSVDPGGGTGSCGQGRKRGRGDQSPKPVHQERRLCRLSNLRLPTDSQSANRNLSLAATGQHQVAQGGHAEQIAIMINHDSPG